MGLFDVTGNHFGVQVRRPHMEASPRAKSVRHPQSQNQGKRADNFKIEQSLGANPAGLADTARSRNTQDNRAQNHRRDEHFDERNEALRHRLHGDAHGRPKMPHDRAEDDHQSHPVVKLGPKTPEPALVCGRVGG